MRDFFSSIHSFLFVAAGTWLLSIYVDEIPALKVGCIILAVCSILIIMKESRRVDFKFTPISIVTLPALISGAIAMFFIVQSVLIPNGEMIMVTHRVPTHYIFEAWLLTVIGAYFFLLGISQTYSVAKYRALFSNVGTKRNDSTTLFILYSVGILMNLGLGKYASLGMFNTLLTALPHAVIITFAVQDIDNPYLKARKNNLLILLTIILFFSTITQFSKSVLIYSIVPLLFYYLLENKIKAKTIIAFVSFFLLIYFFIFPFVNAARTVFTDPTQKITFENVNTLLEDNKFSAISDENNLLFQKSQSEIILSRLSEITATGFIVGEVYKKGSLNGSGLNYVLYAVIPRFLWKEKPITTQGTVFATYIGTQNISIGMTAVGELFWNYGVTGVIVGMLLLGVFWGHLINTFLSIRNIFIKSLGLFILLFHINSQAEWGSSFIGVIIFIIIFKALELVFDATRF